MKMSYFQFKILYSQKNTYFHIQSIIYIFLYKITHRLKYDKRMIFTLNYMEKSTHLQISELKTRNTYVKIKLNIRLKFNKIYWKNV